MYIYCAKSAVNLIFRISDNRRFEMYVISNNVTYNHQSHSLQQSIGIPTYIIPYDLYE